MKNKDNKIRSKIVKESLLDYSNLADTLKENTQSAVKSILDETVRKTYADILNESDDEDDKDKDYDVGEVEDTDADDTSNDDATDADVDDTDTDVDDTDADVDDTDTDDADEESAEDIDDAEDTPDEDGADDEISDEGGDDKWNDFDQYKVSDKEYDFRNAKDDDVVKVYKLLKDDDQVNVVKDDDKVQIKDNETGAEYIITMDDHDADNDDDVLTDDADTNFENNDEDMNESRLYELVMEDGNVGYTDNYQNRDVVTGDDVNEPRIANVKTNDWDKGVPHSNSKPWANPNKKAVPFNEEDETAEPADDADIEEASHTVSRGNSGNKGMHKSWGPSNPGHDPYGTHEHSIAGKRVSDDDYTNESIIRKANKIFNENQELKRALGQFKGTLTEAAVTNVNLGGIIKLITENPTTTQEKKEILRRFGTEAHTVNESKNLYKTISMELKNKPRPQLAENKQISVEGSKNINESKIYQDEDIMDALDLMHRMHC
jgi:hypothetical protein